MTLLASGISHIGQKRKSNQDSIYYNSQAKLFVVADGMGGHNGGDIASALAVKCVPEYLVANHDSATNAQDLIKGAIKYANNTIHDKAIREPLLKGMGTTVVALYFSEGDLHIGNVGDSRAYLINHKKLYQLSRDHSLVQEKIHLGIYTREQAANDPHKNVLIRSVGFDPDIEIDLFQYKVVRGDLFILCSDGLHGLVSEKDLLDVVNTIIPDPTAASQLDLDKLVSTLVALANYNGGSDNVSVIVAAAQ